MIWVALHPKANEHHLGFIPSFLSEDDERPAKEQFDANYAHGGGWLPYPKGKWEMRSNGSMKYPGDPVIEPLFMTALRNETIIVYEHAIVAIQQQDGSFEVARLD